MQIAGMLNVATELLQLSRDKNIRFAAIGTARMLYGLQKLNSSSPEVHEVLSMMEDVVNNCQDSSEFKLSATHCMGCRA